MVNDIICQDSTSPTEQTKSITINGVVIESRKSDGYVNLTALCKAGEKSFKDFYKRKETKSLLLKICDERMIVLSIIIKTTRGRNAQTWGHPDLAVDVAQWLKVDFKYAVIRLVQDTVPELAPPLTIEEQKEIKSLPQNPAVRKLGISTRNDFTDSFFDVGKGRGEIIASTKKITIAIFDMPPERVKFHLGLKESDNLRDHLTGYSQGLFQIAESIIMLDLKRQQQQGSEKISSTDATRKAIAEIERIKETFENGLGNSLLAEEIALKQKARAKLLTSNTQLSLFDGE